VEGSCKHRGNTSGVIKGRDQLIDYQLFKKYSDSWSFIMLLKFCVDMRRDKSYSEHVSPSEPNSVPYH
jgi:hypothetical protein